MTWLTHTTFAGLTAWIFDLKVGVAVLGSTAPDWTEDLFGLNEHRGLTHYLAIWFGLVIFFLIFALEGFKVAVYPLSFCYGGLSHIFLDMLTKTGVPLIGKKRVRIGGLITTGKISEWIFLVLIVVFLFPLTRLDVKFGYSKWKEYYQNDVIDKREYEERRFKIW